MDFSQIQFQTSLYIDLFIKNYLARLLKFCGSKNLHLKKNSGHKILIR